MQRRAERWLLGGVAAVVLTLELSAPATAGGLGERIAKDSASGDFAIASTVDGNVNRPRAFTIKVTTRPAQRFRADVGINCSRSTPEFQLEDRSPSFRGTGRRVKKLKLPMSRPDQCGIYANAGLRDRGRITVTLYAKKR